MAQTRLEVADEHRKTMYHWIQVTCGDNRNVFLTSRAYQTGIWDTFGSEPQIKIKPNISDIRAFGKAKAANCRNCNDKLRTLVVEKVVEQSSGSFLQPSLHLANIGDQTNPETITESIEIFTNQVDSALGDTIKRIKKVPENEELAFAVFTWMIHAICPLKLQELLQGLAAKRGDTSFNDMRVTLASTLVEACCGLIEVDESDVVRFAHVMVFDYLKRLLGSAPRTIDVACLTTLLFGGPGKEAGNLVYIVLKYLNRSDTSMGLACQHSKFPSRTKSQVRRHCVDALEA